MHRVIPELSLNRDGSEDAVRQKAIRNKAVEVIEKFRLQVTPLEFTERDRIGYFLSIGTPKGVEIATLTLGTLDTNLRYGQGKFLVDPELLPRHIRSEDDLARLMETPLKKMGRLQLSEALRRDFEDLGHVYFALRQPGVIGKETRILLKPETSTYIPNTGMLCFDFIASGKESGWTWSSPLDLQVEKDIPAFVKFDAIHQDNHRMDVFRWSS